nr:endocuticle structural glycoprotein SgAbd-2-like [Penaeus vannamei]
MFTKAVICALLAVAAAAPQGYRVPTPAPTYGGGPVVPILVDDRQGPDQFGNYNFNFETGDGISRQEQGAPQGELGAVASQGGWSFTFPDGSPAVFSFVADGAGYQPQSDLLPTPHPLPPTPSPRSRRPAWRTPQPPQGRAPSTAPPLPLAPATPSAAKDAARARRPHATPLTRPPTSPTSASLSCPLTFPFIEQYSRCVLIFTMLLYHSIIIK